MRRLHLVVHGRVQGVGFRFVVRMNARLLALRGWVRNRADGTVEVCAEGPEADLVRLRAEVARGPSHAQVTRVEEEWSDGSGALPAFEERP